MMSTILERLFTKSSSRKTTPVRKRQLRLETLESRELLSVSTADFAAIRSQNADLNLSANMSDYNVIEITANQLSDANLRAAIASAGTTTKSDLIVLRTTATQNKITLGGTELAIDFAASSWGSVTIVGLGTNSLTLDANKKSRIFNINSNTEIGLAGLTITNGYSSSRGGGIYNNGKGTLTITNSTITENSAFNGGGINNWDGTLTVTNSTITENSADYGGGGIYNWDGTLTVTNSTITENSANYDGGGINNWGTSTVTNSTITGNSAYHGGGIYNNGGTLAITNSLTITNSTITENSADGKGGGIYNWSFSTLTVTNSMITENSAFSHSEDGGGGDGIYNSYNSTLTVTNSTITGNSASYNGGGIYNGGTLTLYNTIVAGNSAENSTDISSGSGTIHGFNNLTSFTGWNGSFGSNLVYDSSKPLFVDAANGDYRLAANSQAINKGNNSYVPSSITTDLAGNARIQDGTVDIGAYEKIIVGAPTVTKSLDNNGKPKLTWNAVAGAVTYRVYRLNSAGTGWDNISGNTFNGTTFTDTTVPAGVHTYAVRAFAADGATGSDFVSAKYATVAVTPDAPTVTKILENGKPKLTWNAVTGAVAYRVYRLNADGLGWTNVSGNALKATTFTDTGLSAAGVYTYAVRAFLNDGVTGSAFVSNKYATIGVTPNAPTVTKTLDNGKPKLTWNPVTGAVAYRVYRLNDAGNGWINVSGNALKLTTFTDTTAQAGKTYTYSVQAFLNDGITGSGFVGARYVTVTV